MIDFFNAKTFIGKKVKLKFTKESLEKSEKNKEIIEENNPLVDFSIVEKKKLVIDGKTPIEVIPFLEKCFNKISQFSTDVYTQLK